MNKPRIMIVEDELIVAEYMKEMLTLLNFDVVEVISRGEDAAECAMMQNPDLILMDINLAGEIDGIEAIEEIKLKAYIPFIYVTSHTDVTTLDRAMETMPYGFIIKPDIYKENLLSSILVALNRYGIEKKLRENNCAQSLGNIHYPEHRFGKRT